MVELPAVGPGHISVHEHFDSKLSVDIVDHDFGGSEGSAERLDNLDQSSLAEFSNSKLGSFAGLKGGTDGPAHNALASSSSPACRLVSKGSVANTSTIGRNLARFSGSIGKFDGVVNRSPTLVDKLASKHKLSES